MRKFCRSFSIVGSFPKNAAGCQRGLHPFWFKSSAQRFSILLKKFRTLSGKNAEADLFNMNLFKTTRHRLGESALCCSILTICRTESRFFSIFPCGRCYHRTAIIYCITSINLYMFHVMRDNLSDSDLSM